MSLHGLRINGSLVPLFGLLGALGLTLDAETASAQRVAPFDVRKIISAPGQPSAADKTTLDTYLKAEVFSHFMKPASVDKLPVIRKDLGNIVRGVDKTPGHDFFNAQTYKYASYVVSTKDKRFSPTAKYNALLLLGDLNENDAANKIKPLSESLRELMRVISLPPEDEQAYLKPAALIGITRFAQEKAIPPAAIPPVTEALLKMLAETDPPAGRSASAHNFVRRGAGRALAALGSPGPDNRVVKAFAAIVADPNARLTMRCEMAQFIGELNIPPDAKVDLKALANMIGHQTVEICQQELERATEEKRDPSRRILMYALYSGGIGLSGLSRAAEKDAEALKFISSVKNKTGTLYKVLDNIDDTPDDQIAEKVGPEIDGIAKLLLAKPAAPAPMVAAGPKEAAAAPQKTN